MGHWFNIQMDLLAWNEMTFAFVRSYNRFVVICLIRRFFFFNNSFSEVNISSDHKYIMLYCTFEPKTIKVLTFLLTMSHRHSVTL